MINKIYEKVKQFIVENYKFLICLILIISLGVIELPYVVYTPGGLVYLNDRIDVEGGYEADGSLNMSYVSLMKGKIPILALSFIFKDWDIVKKEEITRDDQSVGELLDLEKLYMTSSIDNATIVAYKAAGKEININKEINNIVYIDPNAQTELKIYDQVLSVEGQNVQTVDDLKKIINTKKEGDYVHILVKRDNKEIDTKSKIYNTEDGLKVGIAFLITYDYDVNPKLNVKTKSNESGSSGGLMLSLAIYNELIKEDITHGLKIVGTGTIDPNGNVGEIDGVKYKLLGAAKKKADVFLCPKENEEEALKVQEERKLDIKIKSVATFSEAIEYLDTLK